MPFKVEISDQSELTKAQSKVFVKAAEGLSYKAIADDLEISEDTVKSHLKVVRETFHTNNLIKAVGIAVSRGIIKYKSTTLAIFLTVASGFIDDSHNIYRAKTATRITRTVKDA